MDDAGAVGVCDGDTGAGYPDGRVQIICVN